MMSAVGGGEGGTPKADVQSLFLKKGISLVKDSYSLVCRREDLFKGLYGALLWL